MQVLEKLLSKLAKYEFKNDLLNLVINNKKIQLFLDSKKLTNDIGLHTAFLVDGKWYGSNDGLWQIDIRDDICNVTVDWEKIPLRQVWRITKGVSGYEWTVYLDVKEKVKIDKLMGGIILSSDYRKWFSVSESGIFPEARGDWENIYLRKPEDKVFGLENTDTLPGIIYENAEAGDLLLQNTPRAFNGRALRIEVNLPNNLYEKKRYKIFQSKLSVISGPAKFETEKKEKIDQYLKSKELVNGKLKIIFHNNEVKMYWQDKLLSSAQGLHSALYVDGQWLDSSRYKWHAERINERCMYIKIDYETYPIEQFWQISLLDETSFVWKVKTRLKEERNNLVERQTIGVALSFDYEEWFGGYESGYFPENNDSWNMICSDVPKGMVGVKKNDTCPSIMLKNKEGYNASLLVQNGDKNARARYLQASIEALDGANQTDDTQFDFVQEIIIRDDLEVIENNLAKKIKEVVMQRGIENEKLKLLADEEKLRIFWCNREVTTDIGLHTAICSQDKWYDSGKMNWKINKLDSQKMEIIVDFKPFPVVQRWILSLDNKNTISWKVLMDVKKTLEVDEHKAGLIIKSDYKKWFNAFEEGDFPDDFGFWDDMIRNRDGETFGVFPAGENPGIMFSVDDNHLSLIQNTDENIRGRVLQGQIVEVNETKLYKTGEMLFFEGKIWLTEDIKDIDKYKKQAQPLLVEPEYIYIYGNSAQLHERIAGVKEFDQKVEKIRQLEKKAKIRIGVSRYNFFMLDEIVNYAAKLLKKRVDLRSVKLNVFPLRRLRRNFIEHLDALKAIANELGDIELVLTDKELFEMLTSICSQSGAQNERQLLRLLGVICENAFIGPQIVVIDPHHQCNANCVHCWVHTPGVHHDKEFYDTKLEWKKFKDIADDLSELMTDLLIFQGDGEPLMYNKFFDMLEYAVGKNLQVSFFTNGILLDKNKAEKAIELGVNEIFCSLPAGTSETFAKINTKQKEEVFVQILKNLKDLSQMKKKMDKNKPRLIMTHVIHTLNAHELYEMAVNDIEIGADVMRFYLIRLDENIEFLKLKEEDIEAIRETLPRIRKLIKGKDIKLLDTTEFQLNNFEQKSGNWSKDVFLDKGCTLGWNFSLIPAAGNISFCCHLRTVGYLKEKSFKEIWTSKEYGNYRYQAKFLNKHKQAKFLNGTTLWDSHCEQCDTHQVIRDVWDQFKSYNLEKFFGG